MKKVLFALILLLIPFAVKADNLQLNRLVVDGKEIMLEDNIYEYEVSIPNDQNNIIIDVEVNDGIEYKINGNEKLVVGLNKATITLTNETDIQEYKINILKMAEDVIELSNNNKLKNISISGYPLGFDANKLEYNLTIGSEAKLNITYEKESSHSEVYIEGNEQLKSGSVIKIKVIAQSGDVREYKINITATAEREIQETTEENKIDMKLVAYIVSAILISAFLVIINVTGKEEKKSS